MVLTNSPLCRRRGAEEVTSAHVLCECEDLATLRHTSLGSFSLDPEDVRSLSLGTKGTGLPWLGHQSKGHQELAKGLRASASKGVEPICYSILFHPVPSVKSFQSWTAYCVFTLHIPCVMFGSPFIDQLVDHFLYTNLLRTAPQRIGVHQQNH